MQDHQGKVKLLIRPGEEDVNLGVAALVYQGEL